MKTKLLLGALICGFSLAANAESDKSLYYLPVGSNEAPSLIKLAPEGGVFYMYKHIVSTVQYDCSGTATYSIGGIDHTNEHKLFTVRPGEDNKLSITGSTKIDESPSKGPSQAETLLANAAGKVLQIPRFDVGGLPNSRNATAPTADYSYGEVYSVFPAEMNPNDAGKIQVQELGQLPANVTLQQPTNVAKLPSGKFIFHVLDQGVFKDLTCQIEIIDQQSINQDEQ